MTKYPFSVLLSVYGREKPEYFKSSLNSLLKQTLPADEVVIVKDGPIGSELEDVLKEFEDLLPLKIYLLPTNAGLGKALAFGLNQCSHELIARMDSDDICFIDRFETQILEFKTNPKLDISSGYILEFQNEIGDRNVIRRVPIGHEETYKYTFRRCPFNHPATMFKKSAVLKVGSYRETPFFEDYYLWIRMAKSGCILGNTKKLLLHYRVGNNMISRRHGLTYAIHEYNFFNKSYQEGLIDKFEFFRFCLRFPIRLLPLSLLGRFYDFFLRT